MSVQRELPTARVWCCRSYMVSLLHFAPACHDCGRLPHLDELPAYWGESEMV